LFMIEVECARHARQAELAWTRQTIAEIRDGRLSWPGAARTGQGRTRSAPADRKGSTR
jgi:hypothetical protein